MERKEYFKLWQNQNREKVREYNKKYYYRNREQRLEKIKEYDSKSRKRKNSWYKDKRDNNFLFKLSTNIKRAIQKSFEYHNNKKKNRTSDILGCSIQEFKTYIESKFEEWMTWKNHGVYIKGQKNSGWDLDHIIPISSAK